MPSIEPKTSTSRVLINKLADWLMQKALDDTDLESVVMGCCERLHAAGIPLYRGYFSFSVLHPLYSSMGFTWTRGQGVAVRGYPHVPGKKTTETFARSPHAYMLERKLEYLRLHLDREQGLEFPIFEDLRAEGATDYLAFIAPFTSGELEGMIGSWSSDQTGGFAEADIEVLLRIQDRLAVACKMAVRSVLTRNVLETYLGTKAGDQVLNGQIHRGDGESIQAVIWYSDLRGSTAMADTLPRQDYISALNDYFDAAGGAVVEHGGEILSFIGDGLLAIFPVRNRSRKHYACRCGIDAGNDALLRIAEKNQLREKKGLQALNFGIALHRGEVMFGNVGVPERLTFSVFGAAVNEVVRLERLTSSLDEPILLSDSFAESMEQEYRPMGNHVLRGVERDIPVFAPKPVPLEAVHSKAAPA